MRTISIGLLVLGGLALVGVTGCNGNDNDVATGEQQRGGQQWVYYVQRGDTTWEDVAGKVYGDRRLADRIRQANPRVSDAELVEGVRLVVPEEPGVTPPVQGCRRAQVY